MAPRSGLNKTAPAAVLHGSMFSSPCAKAHRRTKCAQPRKRRRRGYYTMAPRSNLNKTAPAAVLHGSMFSSPCAKAHRRTKCAQPQAATGLKLLYHENRGKRSSAFSRKIKRAAQNVPPAAVQEKPHALSTVFPPAAPFPAKGRRQAAARAG